VSTAASLSLNLSTHRDRSRPHQPKLDPLRWLSTPRVLAIAVLISVGVAAGGSAAIIVLVTMVAGVPLAAIWIASLDQPLAAAASALTLAPVLLGVTLPTMLIWAFGAIGTRRAVERLRRSGAR
jgi:hypothetical protein